MNKNSYKVDIIRDSIVRSDRNRELVVRGVPFVSDENILDILQKIAELISFRSIHANPFNGFRLPLRPINSLSSQVSKLRVGQQTERQYSPSIIMKFRAIYDKEDFMHLYFVKKGISTKDIGFMVDSRIFIGENFSPLNHKLLIAANKLKQNGLLCSVFTNDGLVYAKKSNTDNRIRLYDLSQLNKMASG